MEPVWFLSAVLPRRTLRIPPERPYPLPNDLKDPSGSTAQPAVTSRQPVNILRTCQLMSLNAHLPQNYSRHPIPAPNSCPARPRSSAIPHRQATCQHSSAARNRPTGSGCAPSQERSRPRRPSARRQPVAIRPPCAAQMSFNRSGDQHRWAKAMYSAWRSSRSAFLNASWQRKADPSLP